MAAGTVKLLMDQFADLYMCLVVLTEFLAFAVASTMTTSYGAVRELTSVR